MPHSKREVVENTNMLSSCIFLLLYANLDELTYKKIASRQKTINNYSRNTLPRDVKSLVRQKKYRILHLLVDSTTTKSFLSREEVAEIRDNKLFGYLSVILFLIQIYYPNSSFKISLLELLNKRPQLVKLKDMGFPEGGTIIHFGNRQKQYELKVPVKTLVALLAL